jgi:uncharacterized protein with PIN domain
MIAGATKQYMSTVAYPELGMLVEKRQQQVALHCIVRCRLQAVCAFSFPGLLMVSGHKQMEVL